MCVCVCVFASQIERQVVCVRVFPRCVRVCLSVCSVSLCLALSRSVSLPFLFFFLFLRLLCLAPSSLCQPLSNLCLSLSLSSSLSLSTHTPAPPVRAPWCRAAQPSRPWSTLLLLAHSSYRHHPSTRADASFSGCIFQRLAPVRVLWLLNRTKTLHRGCVRGLRPDLIWR